MQNVGTVFTRPRTPAAKCLHLVRLNPIITRSELVEATGLSQPTITRATAALLGLGLLQERTDLTRSRGRGRPTVPLEVADNGWMLAGLAIGTSSTYIALYDSRGRTIREDDFPTPVSELSTEDFIQHIMAGVNMLSAGIDRTLVSVGVATSGYVDAEGLVFAPNLGWEGMDIAARLQFQFGVPITVTSVVPAILGSETQAAGLDDAATVLALFADDSVGAALSDADGVHPLRLPTVDGADASEALATAALERQVARGAQRREALNERARKLAALTVELIQDHQPATVVIAGGAFYDDADAPRLYAGHVRAAFEGTGAQAPALRMIPNHREIVRAIARAAALDPLLRTPLELEK